MAKCFECDRQSFFTDPNGFDWIGSRTLYISAKCRLALTLTVTKTASNPKRATRPFCWPYWGKHHQSKDHLLKRDMRTVVVLAKVYRTIAPCPEELKKPSEQAMQGERVMM
uniref:Uncharacterized protein n=1 Tax=Anopheles coluzzii TaxID=1518534 RepID=A0A8W7Q2Y7_ANOCL